MRYSSQYGSIIHIIISTCFKEKLSTVKVMIMITMYYAYRPHLNEKLHLGTSFLYINYNLIIYLGLIIFNNQTKISSIH